MHFREIYYWGVLLKFDKLKLRYKSDLNDEHLAYRLTWEFAVTELRVRVISTY
jgi:hypothetical protein